MGVSPGLATDPGGVMSGGYVRQSFMGRDYREGIAIHIAPIYNAVAIQFIIIIIIIIII